MANRYYFLQEGDPYNLRRQSTDGSDTYGTAAVGKLYGYTNKGALRFPSVALSQGITVTDATLRFHVAYRSASGTLRSKTNGIKETNTADFSSSPFGRTLTSAQTTRSGGVPDLDSFYDLDVTSAVNEILGQGGWASGNAMGFIVDDNGSDSSTYLDDQFSVCQLRVRLAAEPDFTPTPSSIAAPTFPGLSSYGIKVSMPGVDVKTATESQLYFTTRKKQLRVAVEEEIVDVFTKAHSLGYAPCVLAYFNDTGKKYLMNRQIGPVEVGNYVASNASNVIFSNNTGVSIYYYMFIDPLT